MVLVAAWTNERLAHFGKPNLAAGLFAGPGAGIFIGEILSVAISALHLDAAQAWLSLWCFGSGADRCGGAFSA